MKPKRSKRDVQEAFVAVCNTAQPDHQRRGHGGVKVRDRDAVYPLGVDNVDWSYCQHSSQYWAKCGPRRSNMVPVGFSGDWKTLRSMPTEKLITTLCHEAAHIAEGGQTPGGGHNPRFWREVAFIVGEVLDNPERVEAVLGEFDSQAVIGWLIRDPNPSIIDGRMVTLLEQRQRLARLMRPWIQDDKAVIGVGGSTAARAMGNTEE